MWVPALVSLLASLPWCLCVCLLACVCLCCAAGLTMGQEGWYLEPTGRMALYTVSDFPFSPAAGKMFSFSALFWLFFVVCVFYFAFVLFCFSLALSVDCQRFANGCGLQSAVGATETRTHTFFRRNKMPAVILHAVSHQIHTKKHKSKFIKKHIYTASDTT